ncbi:MAG: IMP dehydrogenase [Firmicutes bacterium]|nr:IMP dehydrogenase [Bacillota bacterium]
MAKYNFEPSRTLGEFLLMPNLTRRDCMPQNVSLSTPLVKFRRGEKAAIEIGLPFVSAMMQSVSGEKMAVALSDLGGVSFIYCSQTIEDQAKMVASIKKQGAIVGAGVNTRDYEQRIWALVNAGVDVLCIDSSDGFSEWQSDVIAFVRKNFGDKVKIGAGNVVEAEGFRYLADAGADFVKVGIGGGSICITREQKGIGRGQASALIEVVAARDEYFAKTGVYIPLCSDGGIVTAKDIIIALAMGADFVMLGRYLARYEESASEKVVVDGKEFKEYWGEGSARAQNWQRYDSGGTSGMKFVEGVDSYIPYGGKIADGLGVTVAKIKSTMCNCGSLDLPSFTRDARLVVVSDASLKEGGAHNLIERAR